MISNHFRNSVGGPEKAGVGGSIPSLATINFNSLAIAKNVQILSREREHSLANVREPSPIGPAVRITELVAPQFESRDKAFPLQA